MNMRQAAAGCAICLMASLPWASRAHAQVSVGSHDPMGGAVGAQVAGAVTVAIVEVSGLKPQ